MNNHVNSGLDSIAREILFKNEDAFSVWDKIVDFGNQELSLETLKKKLCESDEQKAIAEVVLAQAEAYKAKGKQLAEKGYQLPEPYCGDLGNASIVFLSSNPGFTPNEKIPRYHKDAKNGEKYYSLYGMDANKPVKENRVTESDILDFYKNRFQDVNIKPGHLSVAKTPNKKNEDGYKKVPFSENLIIFSALLQSKSEACISEAKRSGDVKFVKDVLKDVALIDVVPYKSQAEKGVLEILNACMERYTQRLLAQSKASIIVLVGSKVKGAFFEIVKKSNSIIKKVDDAEESKDTNLFDVCIEGRQRSVISIPHFSHRVYSIKYRNFQLHEQLPPIISPEDFDKLSCKLKKC